MNLTVQQVNEKVEYGAYVIIGSSGNAEHRNHIIFRHHSHLNQIGISVIRQKPNSGMQAHEGIKRAFRQKMVAQPTVEFMQGFQTMSGRLKRVQKVGALPLNGDVLVQVIIPVARFVCRIYSWRSTKPASALPCLHGLHGKCESDPSIPLHADACQSASYTGRSERNQSVV